MDVDGTLRWVYGTLMVTSSREQLPKPHRASAAFA